MQNLRDIMKKKNKDRLFSKFLFEEENQVIPTDVMPRDTTQPQNYSLDQKVEPRRRAERLQTAWRL
jgi:hypothetical protein